MAPGSIQRRLEGRRCDALVAYEAHDAAGLVDGVAALVLGLDFDQRGGEWARVFFDTGGWSWTTSTEEPAVPEHGGIDVRLLRIDLAAMLGIRGSVIGLAELVPRAGGRGRLLLGFDTGAILSIDHDGKRSHLRIIPPAA